MLEISSSITFSSFSELFLKNVPVILQIKDWVLSRPHDYLVYCSARIVFDPGRDNFDLFQMRHRGSISFGGNLNTELI